MSVFDDYMAQVFARIIDADGREKEKRRLEIEAHDAALAAARSYIWNIGLQNSVPDDIVFRQGQETI